MSVINKPSAAYKATVFAVFNCPSLLYAVVYIIPEITRAAIANNAANCNAPLTIFTTCFWIHFSPESVLVAYFNHWLSSLAEQSESNFEKTHGSHHVATDIVQSAHVAWVKNENKKKNIVKIPISIRFIFKKFSKK